MSYNMIIAIVPSGFSKDVLESACAAGATGGTVIHGRGAARVSKTNLLGLNIESDEEIVMVIVPEEITEAVCERINRDYDEGAHPGGALYVLDVVRVSDSQISSC